MCSLDMGPCTGSMRENDRFIGAEAEFEFDMSLMKISVSPTSLKYSMGDLTFGIKKIETDKIGCGYL